MFSYRIYFAEQKNKRVEQNHILLVMVGFGQHLDMDLFWPHYIGQTEHQN